VYDHAAGLARGEQPALPSGSVPAWTYRSGSVGLVAAGSPNSLSTIAVGLCLDDRPETLGSTSHEASWRLWLQLSNLLAFKPIGLTIGSVASVVSVGSSATAAATLQESAADLSPAWTTLLEQATELERALLVELAVSGVDILPELGFEVEGYPIDIAWPEFRVGIVFDGDGHSELQAAGWTAVGTDIDDIRELLKTKEA
jgi:hypothetical protein